MNISGMEANAIVLPPSLGSFKAPAVNINVDIITVVLK